MTKIRISGVTDLGTARAVAALPIHFVALNITPAQKDFVSPIKIPDYLQWLSGVEVVLQAHHLNVEQAQKIASLLKVDHVELLAEQLVVATSDVKLWAYETEAKSVPEAFAVVTESPEELSERRFYRIKDAAERPTNSQAFDINVLDFSDSEGVDVQALGVLVEALSKE